MDEPVKYFLVIALLFSIAVMTFYSSHNISRGVISGDVIILSFIPGLRVNNNRVKLYPLDIVHLSYEYSADTIIIVTHTASIDNYTILLALRDKSSLTDEYVLRINGSDYKAVRIVRLLVHLHSYTLVLIGCRIDRGIMGRLMITGDFARVYYTTCKVSPGRALEIINRILIDRTISLSGFDSMKCLGEC